MADDQNMNPAENGDLKKLIVYVPLSENGGFLPLWRNSVNADGCESLDEPKNDLATRNKEAVRAAAKRAELAERGLAQMNVIVKNTPDFRSEISAIARRTATAENWEEVIRADPIVKQLVRSLDSAKVRLLRIDDLEERHRRAYEAIVFRETVMASRGIKRFLLYLAGFLRPPIR